VPRGQRDGSLQPYSRFSRQEPLLFYQVAVVLTRLSGPRSRSTTFFSGTPVHTFIIYFSKLNFNTGEHIMPRLLSDVLL
jgi:hypothetical protein